MARTKKEYQKVHKNLHNSLDQLLACMITNTELLPSEITALELLEWSAKQTKNPICFKEINNLTTNTCQHIKKKE